MAEINLTGQVAVVTGASRGIGAGILKDLAAAGAAVIGLARSEADLAAVVKSVVDEGGNARAVVCDVSDAAAVKAAVDGIVAEFGKIDVLVNNAGITKDTLILRMSESDWDQVMQVNLRSTFLLTKAVSRVMLKARAGSVINITSIVGMTGNAGQANYAASKAGIIGFTKSIAKEFGSRNIRCNAIAPGFIETDMTDGLSEELKTEAMKRIPLGRLGTVDDIAGAVLFLASDLSQYITGQTLVVAGGMGEL